MTFEVLLDIMTMIRLVFEQKRMSKKSKFKLILHFINKKNYPHRQNVSIYII